MFLTVLILLLPLAQSLLVHVLLPLQQPLLLLLPPLFLLLLPLLLELLLQLLLPLPSLSILLPVPPPPQILLLLLLLLLPLLLLLILLLLLQLNFVLHHSLYKWYLSKYLFFLSFWRMLVFSSHVLRWYFEKSVQIVTKTWQKNPWVS